MKVKAKCWINSGGTWHKSGDVFEISTTDAEALEGMIELAETPVREEPEPSVAEEPKRRRSRQKKTED